MEEGIAPVFKGLTVEVGRQIHLCVFATIDRCERHWDCGGVRAGRSDAKWLPGVGDVWLGFGRMNRS